MQLGMPAPFSSVYSKPPKFKAHPTTLPSEPPLPPPTMSPVPHPSPPPQEAPLPPELHPHPAVHHLHPQGGSYVPEGRRPLPWRKRGPLQLVHCNNHGWELRDVWGWGGRLGQRPGRTCRSLPSRSVNLGSGLASSRTGSRPLSSGPSLGSGPEASSRLLAPGANQGVPCIPLCPPYHPHPLPGDESPPVRSRENQVKGAERREGTREDFRDEAAWELGGQQ